ncbi:diguanylate cyclase [Novosphingobium malaysiense]|uniref:diguanylate cyclase n=1 Tax=Novosphingobium malaysiense TaxID=1348853 RepID=A0A0B1ZK62_9SPHN|nr:diguanylate cyclase [Novosphingobium malaysiense]
MKDYAGADPGFDPDVYRTLLESTLAIPWRIDWATMTFAYIGPQIEPLLGWPRGSWKTIDDWASRIHEEDRQRVVDFCVSQSMAGVDHEADYRALTRDNGYVWIRDVVHVVRDETGKVESLVGFMFDITERKKTEQDLLDMQKRLETLSFEDGLTGASNRRMFDNRLETEWKSACRKGTPLSAILIDLDHFKQFNDRYGHIAGDECLIRVAGALKQAGRRPRDVVARFGGEEFVILLPETDAASALHLAECCRDAIDDLQIPHEGSQCSTLVTASIGVGTTQPAVRTGARDFLAAVDRLLYAAKQQGRNRIVAATV